MYAKYFKRIVDIAFSFCALIALSPVIAVVALLVRVKLGSPVIFKQARPGRREALFTLYKFRTMNDLRGDDGELLPDGCRMTPFGNALRTMSLDELPELLNILKGDMSVIGPRPLLVEYLPLYNGVQRRRHEVRPGLSGLAQVRGRNARSWEQKFADDVEYVDNISLKLDLSIFFRTIGVVLSRKGINDGQTETAKMFEGNPKDE